ncbi:MULTISPECIES: bifunctional diaminohydroxyphosphoribosylaminopyrimidine deaminase/5-amino-6-(5-phosphoribosylamino)uracil reductase RibD [unclassified Lentimonas]|uniref:bifunctional diaminohydroxyphosphoribosylaminopyrimidine deaminase/5-amino-6-(5-phosphoribosylamino)uracil reductase RibD n=1 Tax=unclassified Lentimonas TaxID=2630993 RepID=UPI0013232291|nr:MULTISPECIES: bifunctional diaminohydroxyphosphoribosylaminopyrimidine deaminase/5-amino-6-(5-phosphoribosylamino)uracil reductase RibD [unclassified Lentimonas]CAA6689762.1 Diaminohydroxyphosphoribosylaminopyrimidine deaminase (EC / 5-amino-6-(5-phosphoribosylamino)uracil reductase (EC [Lentimonas sp. CC10]CAA6694761.1 Diaminohydroxyphosphoribosylaminopyrimidine deaminase (EC / 5-amino-6-(5-phosphoribosylamino)uracil reductase (EC [Lentimonas sp. CC19]CAA7069510.1 Diaminohydroxyphosphoribosy
MTLADQPHEVFMARALELARRAWGQTHPNPMVGAVIVEQGQIVAEGWHHAAGQPHAEIEALRGLGRKPAGGATIYVTLEPCSTCGRTGACTSAILEAGIRKVVVGAVDPNPDHAGQGLALLREAGVDVVEGIMASDCTDLNLIFNHWIVQQRPLVAAKMALTLDGKFAAASGHSQWVTGEAARADVMRWRRYFPAIAVGANTVLRDNPSLTSRIDNTVWCPIRFVFDRSLKTVSDADWPQLYSDVHKERTIVLCGPAADVERRGRLTAKGVSVWELPEAAGHLDWEAFRKRCADEGICGVYVETGPVLASSLIERELADYAFIYQAPKFMSDSETPGIGSARDTQSMREALQLNDVRHAILGEDILTRGSLSLCEAS